MRTLYLSYFGLREPLVQTQVLPYLRQIRKGGVEIYLLTFEPQQRRKWTREERERWRRRLEAEGIKWHSLAYHKRPSLPATLYDIAAGARFASRLVRRYNIDVIHARGHVAAAVGALAKRGTGSKLIFDIRGFMPEEYVDAGLWSKGGHLYRWTKAAEGWLFNAADGFVVLTEKARDILFPGYSDTDSSGRPLQVIPCCVDPERFRIADTLTKEDARKGLGLAGRRILIYVGALGGWYLTEEMAEFFAAAHQQDASTFSMILTQSPPEMIEERFSKLGVGKKDYIIRHVLPEEIPLYMKAADIAVSFIKPCYSKLSSSPTKIAEYLASDLPVICSAGVGDLDSIIEGDRLGVIIREFNREAYFDALSAIEKIKDAGFPDRCRASVQNRFDLDTIGGARYLRLYSRLAERDERSLVESKQLSVAPRRAMRTLYVSYFGLREPLVQTQVLPYLRQIRKGGVEIYLLTFEPQQRRKWTREERERWRRRLEAEDIRWHSLAYHKRPSLPATLYDIAAGARFALRLVRRYNIDVIHARSHVAMAMGLIAQQLTRCRLVFDVRGLMAEEYTDAGIWTSHSLSVRMVKWLERVSASRADQVVVLTRRMRDWLVEQGLASAERIEVIPCCLDSSLYVERNGKRSELTPSRFEVIYVGSVTGLYLIEEMGRFFLALRALQPNAFFRVLTSSISPYLFAVLKQVGLNEDDFCIGAAPPEEVPSYLRRAHLGLSFRKPTFSQIAACPTKIPEYLAAGLPVVCNAGIGDMDDLLMKAEVGIIVRALNSAAYSEAAEKALILAADPDLKSRCARVVVQHFDLLGVGGAGYRRVYQRIHEQLSVAPLLPEML